MPVNPKLMQPGLAREEAETYLDDSMIEADKPVLVFSQHLAIIGADAFTCSYYAQEYQREMPLWDPKPSEPKKIEVQIPPHNGFGNEDDALG